MFPDVFAYTTSSKPDLQLSSFYFKSAPIPPSVTPQPHKFSTNSSTKQSLLTYLPHSQYTPDGLELDSGSASSVISNTPVKPLQLPPSRRVVKLTIVPSVATSAVGGAMVLNVVLCILTPLSVSTVLETLWGSFLYLWLLVTFLQLISHSVYMCTSTAIAFNLFHMLFVAATAVIVPRSLFAQWLWLEACLSVVIAVHQCQLSILVYTHVKHIHLYATLAFLLAMIPMAQLVQLDPSKEETFASGYMYSVFTISTLYVLALSNSRGAVIVEATIGACPTPWQSHD